MAKADPPKKEKNTVGQAGLIGGGSYLNKLGTIAQGPYINAYSRGFRTPNRPLYFKPGKGRVMGSAAWNNYIWRAEGYADIAWKSKRAINSDMAPAYNWKATEKVGKLRKVGKAMRVLGKASSGIGTAWALYDAYKWGEQWHKDNPDYAKQTNKIYGVDLSTNKPGKYGVDY
tara:strand:- start:4843 stop:5358 length:516 start_codon:yes stop_codon:yes gene_type:complete